MSWATWLLSIGVYSRCVLLCVLCPGPLGFCSPVCPLGVLCCVCGVLGHLAPVQRCVCLACCVACAVSWATWLLFIGVPARCVLLYVRCHGPLGPCSPVCPLRVFCCVCGVLSHLAPVLPLCTLGELCCVCGVLGHLAPVHRCVFSVCSAVCMVSWATWLLFTSVPARCLVLCVWCPGPLGPCSAVCMLGLLCCVCGVRSCLAPVDQCARSVCRAMCVVFWATWPLFIGVYARRVVLRVQCPGQIGSCSAVCTLGVLCCVCGVLGNLAPVHQCVRSASFVACAVPWITWLLFTSVPARCLVLCVGCPGPLGSC